MEKTYNPKTIENKWYTTWEHHNYFSPQGDKAPYCIMIPPPNVTGSLHMGHGFQHTLIDTLIRYKRMQGHKTLWQVGTDHAGISTQMVVERQLAAQQQSRHDLGRESFVNKIWDWKQQSGGNISQQMRRLGNSTDWTRERFTMDASLSEAVQSVFIQLYDEGLIYRGKKLVNWDPNFCSAISDLEVINEEEDGSLWHIRYPIADSDESVIVATTRPETMLGDTAVAVHPEDERYQHLIGKHIKLPLCDRLIPIIADDYVEQDFGSGCVKITPAHDFNDYDMGQRHQLPLINILTPTAHLNDQVPEAYQGLERFAARKQIVSDLEQLGLLEKIEPHRLKVPRADRGNTVIEPYLTDQWFVSMESLAEPAIAAVEHGDITFVPENWRKTYFQWLNNIEDWCISRQLWWGHRIPAWYDEQGHIYVAETEAKVREKYNLADKVVLKQDEDVLDTWFSSALWPFSTLGWPQQSEDFANFYPTAVLITGFDIIFFWVARMIMMGLKFTGQVPFKEVYFTGLIRDAEGQKMSKTKGNVIDPIDLIDGISLADLVEKRTHGLMQPWMAQRIEKNTRKEFPEGIAAHGTDAVRFTFCALATTGRDIRFDLQRLEGYRNFCNKLWNAARYILMNLPESDLEQTPGERSIVDDWILSRLQKLISQVSGHLDNYRFDLASQALYEFTWHEFCDWYLELVKPVLGDANSPAAQQLGTQQTLLKVFDQLLRLLHPMMPFITEEIWQQLRPLQMQTCDSIMLSAYPTCHDELIAEHAEEEVQWLQRVISAIRNIRGEMNIAPSKSIPLLVNKASDSDQQRLQTHQTFLQKLAKVESITALESSEQPPASATALVGQCELLVPLKGLIDIDAESQRLRKEMSKLEKDVIHSQKKLANEQFVANAPSAVIEQEKHRLSEAEVALEQLREKAKQLAELA